METIITVRQPKFKNRHSSLESIDIKFPVSLLPKDSSENADVMVKFIQQELKLNLKDDLSDFLYLEENHSKDDIYIITDATDAYLFYSHEELISYLSLLKEEFLNNILDEKIIKYWRNHRLEEHFTTTLSFFKECMPKCFTLTRYNIISRQTHTFVRNIKEDNLVCCSYESFSEIGSIKKEFSSFFNFNTNKNKEEFERTFNRKFTQKPLEKLNFKLIFQIEECYADFYDHDMQGDKEKVTYSMFQKIKDVDFYLERDEGVEIDSVGTSWRIFTFMDKNRKMTIKYNMEKDFFIAFYDDDPKVLHEGFILDKNSQEENISSEQTTNPLYSFEKQFSYELSSLLFRAFNLTYKIIADNFDFKISKKSETRFQLIVLNQKIEVNKDPFSIKDILARDFTTNEKELVNDFIELNSFAEMLDGFIKDGHREIYIDLKE